MEVDSQERSKMEVESLTLFDYYISEDQERSKKPFLQMENKE